MWPAYVVGHARRPRYESCHYPLSVGGRTVSCNYINDLMPVIICKNAKHHVTLYNVIFSNMTDILSHLNYIFY